MEKFTLNIYEGIIIYVNDVLKTVRTVYHTSLSEMNEGQSKINLRSVKLFKDFELWRNKSRLSMSQTGSDFLEKKSLKQKEFC